MMVTGPLCLFAPVTLRPGSKGAMKQRRKGRDKSEGQAQDERGLAGTRFAAKFNNEWYAGSLERVGKERVGKDEVSQGEKDDAKVSEGKGKPMAENEKKNHGSLIRTSEK